MQYSNYIFDNRKGWRVLRMASEIICFTANKGKGGSFVVTFSDGSSLSGYLLWAVASGQDRYYPGIPGPYTDKEFYGAFVATVLDGPMWAGIDTTHVGGTFFLGNHYPHSPGFVGPVGLAVTSQTPEPSSIIYLGTSMSLLGFFRRKFSIPSNR